MTSHVSTDSDITRPRFSQAWRNEPTGTIHATVYLSTRNSSTLRFDSADEVRALISALTEAAGALDRLSADPDLDHVSADPEAAPTVAGQEDR